MVPKFILLNVNLIQNSRANQSKRLLNEVCFMDVRRGSADYEDKQDR